MEGENQEIPVDLLEASKTEAEESMAANLRGGIRPALRSLVVGEQSGIIPRSVQQVNCVGTPVFVVGCLRCHGNSGPDSPRTQIFNSLDFFREEGWEFTFEASYLEIYCDEIRDLVPEEGAPRKGKLHIKHGQDGSVFVEGITKRMSLLHGSIPRWLSVSSCHVLCSMCLPIPEYHHDTFSPAVRAWNSFRGLTQMWSGSQWMCTGC